MYYYRLPKLNAVGAYEQNGWLAVGAETGVLGLVCFCAIILHYGGAGMRARRAALPASRDAAGRAGSLAALSAACVANVFSSFQYNGILIIFVFILALLGSAESGDCLDGSASENVQ